MKTLHKEHTTIRIWSQSAKKLRMIYALTGDSMIRILDRIISAELKRVQEQEQGGNDAEA